MKNILLIFFSISLAVAARRVIKEFTNANNLFAQDLYMQVSQIEGGNFLVSPFSAETVLAFAQSGCKGESAEELRNALHLPTNKHIVESAIKKLLTKFRSSKFYTLRTPNKMYLTKDLVIDDRFKHAASLLYRADSETIDFTKTFEAANTINDWIEKQTGNKIKKLISPSSLNKDTVLVLVNALYFKANWSNPFTDTMKRKFFKTATETIRVEMLHIYDWDFDYYECPHLKAKFLELPFEGYQASMVIVLPNEKTSLQSLENQIDRVFASKHELESTNLNVALPKFKIETTLDFKEILERLGVERIFDPDEADLGGIAGVKGDLFVNEVVQKTLIEVSEGGVEAVAPTYEYFDPTIVSYPKDFIADRPFIFLVKVKDVIIFVGRVIDPSQI